MQITAKSLLASFIALLLVLTLSPFVAYADETVLESTPQEYDVEIGPTLDLRPQTLRRKIAIVLRTVNALQARMALPLILKASFRPFQQS